MTPEEAKHLLLGLSLAKLRGGALTEDEQAFFERQLERYDYKTMEEAIAAHIHSSSFWPQIADLVAKYNEARRPELPRVSQLFLPKPGETLATPAEVKEAMKKAQEIAGSAVSPAPRSRLGLWLDESEVPDHVKRELEAKKGALPLPEAPQAKRRRPKRRKAITQS